ncbi:MAG TPA: hypothetical protein VG873_17255 [Burkholderiales bacterium]|nr:hypothetical protein [Burkholderiales bacterium]
MTRLISAAAAAALIAWAPASLAQQTPVQVAAQQVAALAPQLGLLAGSPANFESLAAGLVLGQPVVMTATTADGITQTVTLTPTGTMTPLVAAQTLERARQALIVRGIAAPTPEQVGVALTGGTLATPLGNALIAGALTGGVNPAAMTVQRQIGGLNGIGGSAANTQALTTGLTNGTPITLTGKTPAGQPTTVTFTAPGGPMSALETTQMLQFASQLLASQGIVNPTPEQVRAALLGGTVQASTGQTVPVRGVLEGRGSAQTAVSSSIGTSFSPTVNTSASPIVGTSNSPVLGNPGTAPGAIGNGPPSPAAQMQGRR